jgi:hypothetical protein
MVDPGYGDVVPVTEEGRVFCVFYSLIGFVLYAKVQTTTVQWINKGIVRRTAEMGSCYRTVCSKEFEYFRLGIMTGAIFLLISAGLFTATESTYPFLDPSSILPRSSIPSHHQ